MNIQKITKEVIENLPSGIYAIFRDNILTETVNIDNLGGGYIPIHTMGSDSYSEFENLGYKNWEDCYIVLASEVKLNEDTLKSQNNYLNLVEKFKENNGSIFAKEVEEACLLMFLEFVLREQGILSTEGNFKGDHICKDSECYCKQYKCGDVMKDCDGGCMYPGA